MTRGIHRFANSLLCLGYIKVVWKQKRAILLKISRFGSFWVFKNANYWKFVLRRPIKIWRSVMIHGKILASQIVHSNVQNKQY